jgi:hypothetical protein
MARRGRRPVLNDVRQREIVALLSVGCSQRLAARYVGCAVGTIRNTIARDASFAESVLHAQRNAEVVLLRQIRKAADKEQYWRAAAWMLERGYPERYAHRGPDVITVEQITHLLSQFCRIVTEEVPVAKFRKNIILRLECLARSLPGKSEGEPVARPPKETAAETSDEPPP